MIKFIGYELEFERILPNVRGTRRFAGATSSAMIEAYVNLAEQRIDHFWADSIIVP